MCIYSMISDQFRDTGPWRPLPHPYTPDPFPPSWIPTPPSPTNPYTQKDLDAVKDLIERVRKLEQKLIELGETPECVESKSDWIDEVQAVLDKHKKKGPGIGHKWPPPSR